VHRSDDNGSEWRPIANITGIYWAEFIALPSGVYLLGTASDLGGNGSAVVVSKCIDAGLCVGTSWSTPVPIVAANASSPDRRAFHTSGAGWTVADGMLYRPLEVETSECDVGGTNPIVMAASVDCSDLRDAACWAVSKPLCYDPAWRPPGGSGGDGRAWEEGTAVTTAHGLTTIRFNRTLPFPSGSSRFTVRYLPSANAYFALVNPVDSNRSNTGVSPDPCGQRNVLALATSSDLIHWRVCGSPVLWDDTGLVHARYLDDASFKMTGFQYTHWQFDGADLIYATRAAYRGSSDAGQANRYLFGRVLDFQTKCAVIP
jgi:hypothetical protein